MRHARQRCRRVLLGSGLALALAVTAGCADLDTDGASAGSTGQRSYAAIVESGYVVAIGTGDDSPVEFREEGSEAVVGFVPDLLGEAFKRLGIELRIDTGTFDSLIPSIDAGRADLIVTMGDFADRRNKVDFIDIMVAGMQLVVPAQNPQGIQGIDSMCGMTLSVPAASMQYETAMEPSAACVEAGDPEIELELGGSAEGLLAVSAGRVDAVWMDTSPAFTAAETHADEYSLGGEPMWLAPVGIAVPVHNEKLLAALFAELQGMEEDGTYLGLLEKWDLQAMATKIEINGSKL